MTNGNVFKRTFASVKKIQVISLQHQQFPLETIGQFHLEKEKWPKALSQAKEISGCEEIMFVSTCNRVEWIFTLDHFVCPGLTAQIISLFSHSSNEDLIKDVAQRCQRLAGEEAVLHCLKTAGSLNSAVIGEHEILGQMRDAFEFSFNEGFAQDGLRILMKQCVKTSKQIFTETDLRRKPVSVVSIAWSAFQQRQISLNAQIGLIGAGQIIGNFAKFLRDNQYHNIHVFNRSLSRAEQLSKWFTHGVGYGIERINDFASHIDVWIVCTGSSDYLLLSEHIAPAKKIFVVDLALPNNVHPEVVSLDNVDYFDMKNIQEITSQNIAFREMALSQCEPIVIQGIQEYKAMEQERKIELAMQHIPNTIKEIRETAINSVFQKEFDHLDPAAQNLLINILNYMEKKYISVPMKMAKAVMLEHHQKN